MPLSFREPTQLTNEREYRAKPYYTGCSTELQPEFSCKNHKSHRKMVDPILVITKESVQWGTKLFRQFDG